MGGYNGQLSHPVLNAFSQYWSIWEGNSENHHHQIVIRYGNLHLIMTPLKPHQC